MTETSRYRLDWPPHLTEKGCWSDSFTLPVLFGNQQWIVDGAGMMCPPRGYYIDKSELGCRWGGDPELLMWPLQLSTKGWTDLNLFEEAFRIAITRHRRRRVDKITTEMLDDSFEVARLKQARAVLRWQISAEVEEEMYPDRKRSKGRVMAPWLDPELDAEVERRIDVELSGRN